ncbi:MAG: hypothetical protein ACXW27_10560 [Allosphingosinicella sp.]
MLIVSHDRDFLDNSVTITLGLDGSGKVDIVAGGYEDWQKRREPAAAAKASAAARPAPAAPKVQTKLTYKDQRDLDRLPDHIHDLEAQIARDEEALHDPDLYARDPTRFAALTAGIDKARAERDAAEERWLELAEKLEALAS